MNEKLVEKDSISYLSFSLLENTGKILHGTTTRKGGVSEKPYRGLNLGIFSGDSKENIDKNFGIFCKEMGVERKNIIISKQVHKDCITAVYQDHLKKNRDGAFYVEENDALVTNIRGVMLGIFSADCPTIFVFDTANNAIGLAHAGWKGTVLKIVIQMLHKMKLEYGTKPVNCIGAIGPSIKQCCYEIADNVVIHIKSVIPYWQDFTEYDPDSKKWKLSLQEANFQQLVSSGVKESNIVWSRACTSCHTDKFYSYRKEGRTGRQISFIMLR